MVVIAKHLHVFVIIKLGLAMLSLQGLFWCHRTVATSYKYPRLGKSELLQTQRNCYPKAYIVSSMPAVLHEF